MTLAHWLHRTVQAHPELPAVALGPRAARRYRELGAAAAALAAWLRRCGARRAKPVAIVSENRVEVVETLFACWWCGLTAAPIDPTQEPADLARALAYADAEICFASPRAAGKVMSAVSAGVERIVVYDSRDYRVALSTDEAGAPAQTPTKTAAWLAFSDREPGQPPRAAALSHGALMNMALSLLAEVDSVKPRDAQLHALPWFGPAGFTMLPTLARGGVNVMPETGAFDPAEQFENASRWRRASTLVSDHHLRRMIACGAEMSQRDFRTIVVSGGGVSPELIQQGLGKFGARLARIYGQCAFPLGLTRLNAHDVSARSEAVWAARVRSVGRPFLLTEIGIRAEEGNGALGPGEIGRIFARGHHGMKGYWRDRKSRSDQSGGVWRATGMLGSVDEQGFLSVIGDPDFLIPTRSGDKVAPEQLESALLDRDDVADAGAATRANPSTGAPEIVVFVERRAAPSVSAPVLGDDEAAQSPALEPPPEPKPALDRPAGSTAAFAIAAQYEIDALPRSANGRLQRAALAQMAAAKLQHGARSGARRGKSRGAAA